MKRYVILLFLFLLLTSHELFLKTGSYFMLPHKEGILFLYNGTFTVSENPITRDRIINAKIIGPDYNFIPSDRDYYDEGNVTYLKFMTGNSGTYVAGISTLPRIIELNAKEFSDYLDHEGLTDIIRERKEKGLNDTPAREKYAKHVKALFQVSRKKTEQYKAELGYPVEFISLQNPYDMKKKGQLSFRLLKEGKPLAGHVVHYGYVTEKNDTLIHESTARTDRNGVVSFVPEKKGKWFLSTIYMTESDAKEIDYVSNWATLTFEIR